MAAISLSCPPCFFFSMAGRPLSEVHREHLPAGRYGAGAHAHNPVVDPHAAADRASANHGVYVSRSHRVHHEAYRSVPEALYGAELYSTACCAVFGALAAVQLVIAAHMLFSLAPAFARRSGPALSSAWARGKARWVAALVPGAVARCCALLLLIADLRDKADGAGPGDVSFLFAASSFFDACASWLFYTFKVAALTGWAVYLHGPGRRSRRLLSVSVLASLVLGVALAVTVSFSLSYGSSPHVEHIICCTHACMHAITQHTRIRTRTQVDLQGDARCRHVRDAPVVVGNICVRAGRQCIHQSDADGLAGSQTDRPSPMI